MLEERALDSLVGCPCRGGCKAPYLKRYTVVGRSHQAHEYLPARRYGWMTQKPFTQIGAIESQIGIDSTVDSGQSGVKYRMACSLHLVDISLELGKLCHHLFDKIGRCLSHRIDVDKY